ncbi:MAG: histidine kinase, partial [Salinimicrobium sediminis]|nr:histidine kinase [Salinimicrobium sediminis]
MRFYLLLLFLFSWLANAQELPPVLNFSPNDYNAGNQNWMVSQGEDENVYVANSLGLLEFNGTRWQLYPVPNQTIVRAVKAVGNKIFTGAYMEVGFWEKNQCGLLEYTSLLSKFPSKIQDGEQFWRIESVGNTIIFQSFEGIYLYEIDKEEIVSIGIPVERPISNLFRVGEAIYFLIPDSGIYSIKNGAAVLEVSAEILAGREIIKMFRQENSLQLVTRTGELYNLQEERL